MNSHAMAASVPLARSLTRDDMETSFESSCSCGLEMYVMSYVDYDCDYGYGYSVIRRVMILHCSLTGFCEIIPCYCGCSDQGRC